MVYIIEFVCTQTGKMLQKWKRKSNRKEIYAIFKTDICKLRIHNKKITAHTYYNISRMLSAFDLRKFRFKEILRKKIERNGWFRFTHLTSLFLCWVIPFPWTPESCALFRAGVCVGEKGRDILANNHLFKHLYLVSPWE